MKGDSYYLILIGHDGTKYRVYNKPISLEEMDKRTTRYNNKEELLDTIISNTKVSLKKEDIDDIQILMKPNKNIDFYKNEKGPLYSEDRIVTDRSKVSYRFDLHASDKSFIKYFIKNYENIRNFKPNVDEIRSNINNNLNYGTPLYSLTNKIFSTYKGSRNAYLIMKSYENKFNKKGDKEDLDLQYLIDNDRELLDIDDFIGREELSPFDGNGYGRSK